MMDVDPTKRWCSAGRHWRPVEEFYRYPNGKWKSECRPCNAVRCREYRNRMLADPEKAKLFRKRNKAAMDRYLKKHAARRKAKSKIYHANKSPEVKERHNEASRRYKRENREKLAEYKKQWWADIKTDPKRHAAYLETRRINYRMKAMQAGRPIRVGGARKPAKELKTTVPYKPFADWLELQHETMTYRDMAKVTGVHESKLQQVSKGKYPRVELKTVDTCLTILGGPPHQSLYPDV